MIFLHKLVDAPLKGTVSRDFMLLVFFMNQFPPSTQSILFRPTPVANLEL
jgi:hypothetical protein